MGSDDSPARTAGVLLTCLWLLVMGVREPRRNAG